MVQACSFLTLANPRVLLLLACIWVSSCHCSVTATDKAEKRFFQGAWHTRSGEVSPKERHALREEAEQMFLFGYEQYLAHAFPKDELRPISCRGHNSQGGMALTLLDSLDSLLVFNQPGKLQKAVQWLEHNLSFAMDERVHVFEVTIRALGGLLSSHMLLKRMPSAMPDYNGCLLRMATDLGDRLLPAFDTASGIPLSWVNLQRVRHGH